MVYPSDAPELVHVIDMLIFASFIVDDDSERDSVEIIQEKNEVRMKILNGKQSTNKDKNTLGPYELKVLDEMVQSLKGLEQQYKQAAAQAAYESVVTEYSRILSIAQKENALSKVFKNMLNNGDKNTEEFL